MLNKRKTETENQRFKHVFRPKVEVSGNENDNVTIFLKEAAIEQIFTGYSIKRSLRPNFEQETFVDKDKKFWPDERAMIRENLQKHAELLLKKQVFA